MFHMYSDPETPLFLALSPCSQGRLVLQSCPCALAHLHPRCWPQGPYIYLLRGGPGRYSARQKSDDNLAFRWRPWPSKVRRLLHFALSMRFKLQMCRKIGGSLSLKLKTCRSICRSLSLEGKSIVKNVGPYPWIFRSVVRCVDPYRWSFESAPGPPRTQRGNGQS